MEILVYGCSRLTDALAPVLVQDGHYVTVLDEDADRLAILSRQTNVSTIWAAEPLMKDYLLEGGLEDCDAFFALTEDDHKNVLLCQIASLIFNRPNVLCRLTDPQLQDFYRQLGITILDSGTDFLSRARESLEE